MQPPSLARTRRQPRRHLPSEGQLLDVVPASRPVAAGVGCHAIWAANGPSQLQDQHASPCAWRLVQIHQSCRNRGRCRVRQCLALSPSRPAAARLNSLSCKGSSVVIEPGRAVVVTLAPPMWLARQAKTGRKTLAAGDHVLLQPGYVGHHLALAMAFIFLIRTLSLSPSCVRLCFARTTLTCVYDSIIP